MLCFFFPINGRRAGFSVNAAVIVEVESARSSMPGYPTSMTRLCQEGSNAVTGILDLRLRGYTGTGDQIEKRTGGWGLFDRAPALTNDEPPILAFGAPAHAQEILLFLTFLWFPWTFPVVTLHLRAFFRGLLRQMSNEQHQFPAVVQSVDAAKPRHASEADPVFDDPVDFAIGKLLRFR
jgi:hypothetical protein